MPTDPATTSPPARVRVLLVDDSPANLIALGAVLKPLGVELVEARSGPEALEKAAVGSFAVVLLDVQMPEMDGFEVASRIRATETGRDVPIIFLTAIHRDEVYARRGYESGAADYITKPYDADILRARVRAFADLFRQREELRRRDVEIRTRERDEATRRLVAFERLMHDGEVIGVTQIGSTRNPDFSDVERRLLRAMAERAAWAVAQRFRFDRFRWVLMSAPAIVSIVRGPDFTCEFSNLAHRQLFGDRDVIGRPASELGATPEIVAMFGGVQSTGQPVTATEYPVVADFGGDARRERRFFNFSVQPLRDPVGKVTEILWFAIDVTTQVLAREAAEEAARERAKLLESERAARAEAEIANRAKDDFLATVSHELRTPLNAILGWTVVARRQAPAELERALGIIEGNARAQTRIIEDVLDVSRIVGGKLRLDIAATDVAAAIEGALETVRPEAEAKGVVLSADIGIVGVIAADAGRLQQVVGNVLTNAIKFTPSRGSVDLAAARLGQRIVIRVTDTGEGIDPAFLPYLFEPFRQADGSTTRRHGGLGLGLAIVRQLVQAHGGTIRAESDGPHTGSTFTIEFPARTPQVPGRRLGADEGPGMAKSAPLARLPRLKLLVLDDEQEARTLLEEILSESGALVECASCGEDAFEVFSRFRPDVVVSSVAMPNDGFEFIQRVRGLPPDQGGRTPAIAVMACGRSEDLQRVIDAGFAAHVAKPVDAASLVAAVARLVDRGSERPPPLNGIAHPS